MNNNSASKKSAASITGISVDAIMARTASGDVTQATMPALPSLSKLPAPAARKVITVRGIPQDAILRSLAEEVTPTPAFSETVFTVQHVAPGGTVRTGSKLTASAARASLRTYTNTRGADGERIHIRIAGGRNDGQLVGAYRAERGAWKTIAAFAA